MKKALGHVGGPVAKAKDNFEGFSVGSEAGETEQGLAEGLSRYLVSFLETDPHPIIEVDLAGRVTFLNKAAQKVLENLGMDREDSNAFLPKDMSAILRDWDKKTEVTLRRETAIKDMVFDETVSLVPQFDFARIHAFDATESMNTRAQLKELEERYRVATENSNDGLVLFRGGRRSFVSRKFLQMFGYDSFEELERVRPFHIIHPEDRDMVAGYAAVRQRGEEAPLRYECKAIRKDGAMVHLEVSVASVDSFGETASLVYLRDVSERKRIEEGLYASQRQLAEAMELARIVYWEFDTTTDTYVFNDPFYAFYGTSAEREGGYRMSVGEYAERFVHPDDRPLFYENLRQVRSRSDPELVTDLEHRIVRRDGSGRYILARGRSFRDSTGRLVRLYGANQDISELRGAAAALRESEERCRKMYEESSLGIVMAGSDYHLVGANAAFCSMLGYTETELTSFTFQDITHPDHVGQDTLHIDELYRDKIPFYRTENRYLRKDKQIVWASTTVNTVRDKGGEFRYFLTMVADISEHKRAEEERAALESQLRHAQKMEAIGQLAGGVAHDFNNILTVILGFGSLLRMALDKHEPVSRAHVDQILTASERAADLTRSLLTFSRKQQINLEPRQVNELVSTAGKLLTRLLTEDIELKITKSPENPITMVDVTQMDQILMNLAANARDAMPKGGILSIKTEEVALDDEFRKAHGYGKPGRYALFSVSDTGTGMDEATKEHIFEPFFTTKEVGKGTGLGLSTVYGIVKQHNGYVTVYSEPHHGTTFRIYLPLVDTGEQDKTQPPDDVRGGTETVLVVEDEPGVRKFTTEILQTYGYATMAARDGEHAINIFKKNKDKIDLIIMDVVMPKKNGKEVYEEIRKSSQEVKIIFVSGHTAEVVFDRGIHDVAADYLPKPLLPHKLLRKVREVLDR